MKQQELPPPMATPGLQKRFFYKRCLQQIMDFHPKESLNKLQTIPSTRK
jgi:hypothetical protein